MEDIVSSIFRDFHKNYRKLVRKLKSNLFIQFVEREGYKIIIFFDRELLKKTGLDKHLKNLFGENHKENKIIIEGKDVVDLNEEYKKSKSKLDEINKYLKRGEINDKKKKHS